MLYLTVTADAEEDHGFKIDVSGNKQEGSIPLDLTVWGDGSPAIANAIYNHAGSADAITAIVAAVAQTAFNIGILHQQEKDGSDLIGVS